MRFALCVGLRERDRGPVILPLGASIYLTKELVENERRALQYRGCGHLVLQCFEARLASRQTSIARCLTL
jgi:hypothetical protein